MGPYNEREIKACFFSSFKIQSSVYKIVSDISYGNKYYEVNSSLNLQFYFQKDLPVSVTLMQKLMCHAVVLSMLHSQLCPQQYHAVIQHCCAMKGTREGPLMLLLQLWWEWCYNNSDIIPRPTVVIFRLSREELQRLKSLFSMGSYAFCQL